MCIRDSTNPRILRVVALGIPSDVEKTQWYFQRWVAQLPAGGEIVLFDRSWYTRAITEYVHGFCTEQEYREFLSSCPQFERMLLRSGIILLKYWFSVSDEEQERRFAQRAADPRRRWKLSPMDLRSRDKWIEYSPVSYTHLPMVQGVVEVRCGGRDVTAIHLAPVGEVVRRGGVGWVGGRQRSRHECLIQVARPHTANECRCLLYTSRCV